MSKTEKPSPGPASPNKPDAARRALLRGVAVGIPSVVTLASGSAWAAANSNPCFNDVYAGKIGGDPLKFTQPVGNAPAGAPVTQANTSQFCWNSGTPAGVPAWGNLPASPP